MRHTSSERWMTMSLGGGGASDDAFLIGPFLDWWDKRSAKRTKKLEAQAVKHETGQTAPDPDVPPPS